MDYSHSLGIMHQNLSSDSIMIDHKERGLAELYCPGQDYNALVVSLYFKFTEMLVEYELYDYSFICGDMGVC